MNDRTRPRPGPAHPSGFDRLARVYRPLEHLAFGGALVRARFAHLDALRSASRVLVVGDGDGRCVAQLVTAAPQAAIHCIDTSASMLAAAHRRLPPEVHARVTFELADVRGFAVSPDSWDAVLTMFVLDCLTEDDTRAVVQRLAGGLRPGGHWLWADFAEPRSGWRRVWARLTVRALYVFFGWTTGIEARTLPPAERILAETGLIAVDGKQWLGGLVRSIRYQRPPSESGMCLTDPTRADGCRPDPREC